MTDRPMPKPLTPVTIYFTGGDKITGELDLDAQGDPFIRSELFGVVQILQPSRIVHWRNHEVPE